MGEDKSRILCIEYDRDFCELITIALPEYKIENARNRADALENARTGGFVLIFMEQWLPDGTGEELCRQIRYFDKTTPILFITASRRTFSETEVRAIGAQGLLKKGDRNFLSELQNRVDDLSGV